MNFRKLLDAHGGNNPEYAYAREVTQRLHRSLDMQVDLLQSIAIMHILTLYSFQYDDGFIINDERGDIEIIGLAEAASIVACFWDDPQQDWEWFRIQYWDIDKSTAEYQQVFNQMLQQLIRDPKIKIRDNDAK